MGAELVYLKGLSFWKCRGYVFVVNEKIMITSPIGIATGLPDVIRNVLPYLNSHGSSLMQFQVICSLGTAESQLSSCVMNIKWI